MPLKIYFEDAYQLTDDMESFLKNYDSITAAGGVVQDDKGKILMMFRRGKWDLPKGKAEEGESMETCAEREIKEETGLSELILKKFLITTYHTYIEKGRPILKDTHWFLFQAPGKQDVHPQTEEDISRIEWADQSELTDYTSNTYQLINDVLAASSVI